MWCAYNPSWRKYPLIMVSTLSRNFHLFWRNCGTCFRWYSLQPALSYPYHILLIWMAYIICESLWNVCKWIMPHWWGRFGVVWTLVVDQVNSIWTYQSVCVYVCVFEFMCITTYIHICILCMLCAHFYDYPASRSSSHPVYAFAAARRM